MDVGIARSIILLAHTVIRLRQENLQKKQVLNAAIEKGIPLKHISLEDNRGKPIPILEPKSLAKRVFGVKSAQEKLDESQKNYLEAFQSSLPTMTPSR